MLSKLRHTALPKQKRHSLLAAFSRLTVFLFALGFFAGCLAGNLLQDSLYAPALSLFQNTISLLPSLDIDQNDVFLYSIKENMKYFLLLLFFSLTNVWRLYYVGYTLYTGFSHGLLFAFCFLVYHAGGVLEYFCFLLPHCLLMAPAFLLAVSHFEDLHRNWFTPENNDKATSFLPNAQKRQLIFSKLPPIFLCAFLLACSALLEGYCNIPLLKYFHFR